MYYDHEISTVNNGRWWKVDNRIGADQGGLIKECGTVWIGGWIW